MAGVIERLQFLLTMDSSGAVKGFRNVGSEADKQLGKAQSRADKLGYGMTRLGAGTVAVSAIVGGALVKTAVKFEHAAIAAGKFSDATHLSMEEASRWIVVGRQLNIETGDLQTAFTKMERAIAKSPEKLRELGVEIGRTSMGTVDAQQTFLNLVDRINSLSDPALRAKTAADILGRGWQSSAELIAKGSAYIKQSLAGVDKGLVFNNDDRQKAEQMRKAMMDLSNAGKDLQYNLARGAIPVISQLAHTVAGGVRGFAELNAVSHGSLGAFTSVSVGAVGAAGAVTLLIGQALNLRNKLSSVSDEGVRSLTGMGKVAVGVAAVSAAVTIGTMVWDAYTAKKREAAVRTAEVTKATGDEVQALIRERNAVDAAKVGFEALSTALTSSGDNGVKLTEALGTLGKTTQDAAPTLLGMKGSVQELHDTLLGLANSAGVTGDDAERLVQKVMAFDDPFWGASEANAWLTERLKDVGKAMEEVQDQAEKTDVYKTMSDEINQLAATGTTAQDALKKINAEIGTGNDKATVAKRYEMLTKALYGSGVNAEAAGEKVKTLAEELDDLAGKTSSQINLQEQWNETTVPAIALIKAQADAANYQAEQIKESNDRILEAVNVEKAYRDALLDTRNDIKTYREELKKAGNDQLLVNAIVADHVKTQTDDAAAVAEGRLANMDYIATQDQAAAKSLLQAEALKKVVAQVGKDSPLGRGLQQIITLLEDIPEDVRIRIYAEMTANLPYNPMTSPSVPVPKSRKKRALGGPVAAEEPYLVGEVGPEMFVPSSSGTIIPNSSLGGAPVFNINVTAGMGANPQQIGNEIVSALKSWVRTNGKIAGIAA